MSAPEPLPAGRLAEIRALADAATPGPWMSDADGVLGSGTVVAEAGGCEHVVGDLCFGEGAEAEADLAFVIAARTAVPELLAELDRLQTFAGATERRHSEIRALLAQVDIREGATAWNLGMAVLALLDGPPSPAAKPRAAFRDDHGSEWVRCSGLGCPNAERYAKAAERGWVRGHMDTWLCPQCAADAEPEGEPAGSPAAIVASTLVGAEGVTAVAVYEDTRLTVQVSPSDLDGWQYWLDRFQVPVESITSRGSATTAQGTAPGGVRVALVGHGIARLQAAAIPHITRRGGAQ